jgi:hypothetical protein
MRTLGMTLIAVAAFVATTAAQSATPVVSKISYYPKPIYDDDLLISVSFTTGRAAKPGYEWGVVVFIGGKEPVTSCTSLANSWDPPFGGNAGDHMRTKGKHTRMVKGTRYGYWCPGRLSIEIVEHKIGQRFAIGNPVSGGSFYGDRVLRAP